MIPYFEVFSTRVVVNVLVVLRSRVCEYRGGTAILDGSYIL